jgi:uncharacterized lipoprotein YddW (UPF0748 family)
MMKKYIFLFLLIFCFLSTGQAETIVIDDFNYETTAEARSVYNFYSGDSPVLSATSGSWGEGRVMVLPCRFTPETGRNYWDRSVALDLTSVSQFNLEVYVNNPVPISNFTLYFRDGNNWAGESVSVIRPGWQVWRMNKFSFRWEGDTFDWSRVDRIRLSPWKGVEGESDLALRSLTGENPAILVVSGTSSPSERTAAIAASRFNSLLDEWNVSFALTDHAGVQAGVLEGAEVALFPYNSDFSDDELDRTMEFIEGGGKTIFFYQIPSRIAQRLGVRIREYVPESWPGQFSRIQFVENTVPGAPDSTIQNSWNIMNSEPVPGSGAEVAAWWVNDAGQQLAYPAWVLSPTGAYMSHILLQDDWAAKGQMILAILGRFRPETWQEAADSVMDAYSRVGDFYELSSLVDFIQSRAAQSGTTPIIEPLLGSAETLRRAALSARAQGAYIETIDLASAGKDKLIEAYLRCQVSKPGEFRAVWEHAGLGPWPGDWERGAAALKANGFTAVIPNMLWAAQAHYPSEVLPRSEDFDLYGDQVQQCLNACRAHGLQMHVWKVNWNLSRAPADFVAQLRAEGRTQVDVEGNPVDYLNPAHPENLALEKASLLEVVRNYAVDGIHFDYIRYPDEKSDYSDYSKAKFQLDTGITVESWPEDCYSGALAEEYRHWRVEQITRLVRQVSEEARRIRPEIKISAAVFSNYPDCRRTVGQDWVDWVEKGYLDFVCPMDYTEDFELFRRRVSSQLNDVDGRIPVYPGIGYSASNAQLRPDGVTAQILATRELGAAGFTVFNYNYDMAVNLLPYLAWGVTQPVEMNYLSTY